MSRCDLPSFYEVSHEWLLEDAREQDRKVRALWVLFISSGPGAQGSCVGWVGGMWPIMLRPSIARTGGLIIEVHQYSSHDAASVVVCCLTRPDSPARKVEASRTSLRFNQTSSCVESHYFDRQSHGTSSSGASVSISKLSIVIVDRGGMAMRSERGTVRLE